MSEPHVWRDLGDTILGPDTKIRMAAGIAFLVAVMLLSWCAVIYFIALPAGLLSVGLGHAFMALFFLASVTFYPLVRSGLTRNWSDPGLAVPQMLLATAAVIVAYVTVESVRPVTLQTLCLIQVFGFLGLRTRATRWLGFISMVMLLVMLWVMAAHPSPTFDLTSEAMKVGASCFIMGLLAWQSGQFGTMRSRVSADKRALRTALAEIKRITLHDTLTGLPNRQFMLERIEAERDRAALTGSHFSVVLLDLDHFKKINDTHGHHVGDEALVSFALAAGQALRGTDIIGRWGGEEFVVLMLDTAPAPLGVLGLDRVRALLAETPASQAVPALRVQFSAGIVGATGGETLAQLMDLADQALYQAKAQGRNQTCISVASS
ncbi:MAG: GGDEF domain-containing protein [Aquabacterium sp.]|nr:GGDEF domain-containing protein [Aquabacterium sp.]